MSSRYVHNVMWAYLQANWALTRTIELQNLFNAPAGAPPVEWVTLMPQDSVETQVSVGAPQNQRWREEGSVTLLAFVPSGTGTDRALELAEALRDLFRGKLLDDGAGGPTVTVRQVDPPDTALPSAVEASSGVWYGYAVAAIYYCDFCRNTG